MALSTDQIRTLELGALGLSPNATADQINTRLRTVTPGTLIDNRTGLPYTKTTAQDAGSKQVLGQVVGAAGLGLTLGEVLAGLTRLAGAVSTGEAATGGAGASAAAGTAGAAESVGGSAGAGAGEAAGGAGAAGGAAKAAGNVFKVAKFATTAEFLAFLAWIFHPQTLLRVVEFLVGMFLGAWGVYLLTSRGSAAGATARRIVSLTPAGRTIRVAQGARMGRHEGQREAARMQARQRETRGARESSALERERINRSARQTARNE